MPPLFLMEMSETPAETPDIVGSWIAYERMVALGIGPASLEELMGGAAVLDRRPPRGAAPRRMWRPSRSWTSDSLLYRGDRALARVQELRDLARRTPPDELPALFDEVCDLVDLAIQSGA